MAPREIQIPLFLWITAALVVHFLFGSGSAQIGYVLEERTALRDFAARVQREVQAELRPIPIAMIESALPQSPQPEEAEKEAEEAAPSKPKPKQSKQLVQQNMPEPKPPAVPLEEKKAPKRLTETPKQQPPALKIDRKRAIAVRQHVEDAYFAHGDRLARTMAINRFGRWRSERSDVLVC